jgi:exodeoxyribonuclease-1
MTHTFFFYDLETSGINPREYRIMQFAGQRTDLNLNPIGEPLSEFIKITDDCLPEPDAILLTGITPQKTLADGITETEFLKLFHEQAVTPGTIFVGFNNVRFDDEFMRYLHYRNFYEPYEWHYQDGRSRWDILDVVRMTRALRPQGIKWPVDVEGRATNRLELLTALNKLDHQHAHEALNDVMATIAVARLIKQKQPKLFNYLLSLRDKQKISQLVLSGQPFVYTSGKYPSEYEKTTVAVMIAEHPNGNGALVYDLRHDPAQFVEMDTKALAEAWKRKFNEEGIRLPVKTMKFNRCPAVAPLSVLDASSRKRLDINLVDIQKHAQTLGTMKDWVQRVCQALDILDQQQQTSLLLRDRTVDEQLYDNFLPRHDRDNLRRVQAADPAELTDLVSSFHDARLQALLPLYKARNLPDYLTPEERTTWERYRFNKLFGGYEKSRVARFSTRLSQLASELHLTSHEQYILEDLRLYAESIVPAES